MRAGRFESVLWGMWGNLLAMAWGNKCLINKGCGLCGVSALIGVRAGACTHMHACACMCVQVHSPHAPHTPHMQQTRHFNTPQHAQHIPHTCFLKGNEMVEEKRVIACTQENVAQMRRIVENWPALHELVDGLQKQGCFPGLRGLQITLTGHPSALARGLDVLEGESAVQRGSSTTQGAGEVACN